MKRIIFPCLLLLWLFPVSSVTAQLTGKQVMEEKKKNHDVDSEVTVNTMLLVDSNGNQEQRTIKTYFKDMGDEETRMLVVFDEPASVRGTAMLTWNHKERGNDQWLYLPSQKKLQRIAEGSKKNYFMGTDLTYEDMEKEDIDDYNYTMLDPETLDGQECYVIEAVPIDKEKLRNSGYSKRKLWVRKDIFYTVKAEFYDHRDRHLKTMTNIEMENIEGTIWRTKKAMVDNLNRKHKTLTVINSEEINVKLDDSIFTERFILSEKHIQ